MMPKKSSKPVEFRPFPVLKPPLTAHETFTQLYNRILAIDALIADAKSRKKKLKVVTQTSAVHLTCLKLAQRLAIEQEMMDIPNSALWTKVLIKIAARAQEVSSIHTVASSSFGT